MRRKKFQTTWTCLQKLLWARLVVVTLTNQPNPILTGAKYTLLSSGMPQAHVFDRGIWPRMDSCGVASALRRLFLLQICRQLSLRPRSSYQRDMPRCCTLLSYPAVALLITWFGHVCTTCGVIMSSSEWLGVRKKKVFRSPCHRGPPKMSAPTPRAPH